MAHHEPFKALGPIEWEAVAKDSLSNFLGQTFSHAQTLIDSLPLPHSVAAAAKSGGAGTGRSRSATDPASTTGSGGSVALNRVLSPSSRDGEASAAQARQLHKEWREVKVNPRENPLAINVYKLGGRDGRGAWFARRSIHEGIGFDKFRLGLEREFTEALRARAERADAAAPGTGKVRGIGAERRVESAAVEGLGKAEVYQLSAQFPGPTTPRDFITLLLTSAIPSDSGGGADSMDSPRHQRRTAAPRQFMVVSKPCIHSDCPPRPGFIRGQYESVEIIREVPIEVPLRKVRSSIDLSREDVPREQVKAGQVAMGREAVLRSARRAAAATESIPELESDDDDDDKRSIHSDMGAVKEAGMGSGGGRGHAGIEMETAIEWLMITRSDPGGSVPRFMIEKGTPGGIVSDAGRLLNWLASKELRDLEESAETAGGDSAADNGSIEEEASLNSVEESGAGEEKGENDGEAKADRAAHPKTRKGKGRRKKTLGSPLDTPTQNLVPNPAATAEDVPPLGIYGMIAGALGAAGSVVASRLPPIPFVSSSTRATDSEPDLDGVDPGEESETDSDSSDSSSVRSFSSAVESAKREEEEKGLTAEEAESGIATAMPTPTPSAAEATLEGASSVHSRESSTSLPAFSAVSRSQTQHDKDLRKLEERRRKAQEKIARTQEKSLAKQQEEKQRDATAAAKLREKHEREMARQEEKFQRELKKIEDRRMHEQRKAEERRRKQLEREDRANIALELDRARAERDVALKQIDILKDQIGELQKQNTTLVATLGRHGLLKGGGGADAWKELQKQGGSGDGAASSSSSSLLQNGDSGSGNHRKNGSSGGSGSGGSTKT